MRTSKTLVILVIGIFVVLLGGLAANLANMPAPEPPAATYHETAMPGLYYVPFAGGRYARNLQKLVADRADERCRFAGSSVSEFGSSGSYFLCEQRKSEEPDCAIPAQELTVE